MANLDATLWNDLQPAGGANEKRFQEKGVVDAFLASTPHVDYIPPSAIAAMREISADRGIDLPQIKDQTVTVGTTPGFPYIPTNLEESAVQNHTAIDIFSGFRHYPMMYKNNQIDEEAALAEKMKNIAHGMASTLETLLVTTLSNRKTQLLNFTTQVNQGATSGTYTFNAGTDTLEINKAAQQSTMFSSIDELMTANDLGGDYRYITSRAGFAVQKMEALQFGAGNEKNLQALGMVGIDRMHQTNNIAVGSDVFNGYALRDGSVGLYENHPADFVDETEFAGKKWSITDQPLPFLGVRANIFTDQNATDARSLVTGGTDTNLTMTHWQEMAIWVRVFPVFRYNSDLTTRANDIVKIQGLTT